MFPLFHVGLDGKQHTVEFDTEAERTIAEGCLTAVLHRKETSVCSEVLVDAIKVRSFLVTLGYSVEEYKDEDNRLMWRVEPKE